MEVFSGILLAAVVLGIVGLVLRETIFGGKVLRKDADAAPQATDDPLVGQTGQVVEYREGAETMRVRVRGERWSAGLIHGRAPPVGSEVRVTAVSGLLLQVELRREEAGEAVSVPSAE